MKNKILLLVLVAVLGAANAQQPNDVMVRQRNSTNTGWLDKFLSPPSSGADGLMYIDNTVSPPVAKVVALGSGLTIADGIVSAAGGGGVSQVNSDWAAVSGVAQVLNKPDLSVYATNAALVSGLASKANTVHTHAATDINDSTATGRAVITAATAASARSTLGVQSTNEANAAYYPLSANPANYLTSVSSAQITAALGFTPYNATNPAGYITSTSLSPYLTSATAASTYATSAGVTSSLSTKQNTVALTTTGSGAATFNSTTGALNIPVSTTATPFNFSQPIARTLAVSTSYQATDPTKAAIIVPSYACQNSTTVLAASACTIQVRMGTGALTCSTGTVYYTQSLTVALGVLITQNSTNPVQINLPIGASFIACPVAGTFTISAVEQTAG